MEGAETNGSGDVLAVSAPEMASDLADHAMLQDPSDPPPGPPSLVQVGQRDGAVQDLEAGDPPVCGVVLEQGPAVGDEKRPVGRGQPPDRHRVPVDGARQQVPVAAPVIATGPIDVLERVAGARSREQSVDVVLAGVVVEMGPETSDVAKWGRGGIEHGGQIQVGWSHHPRGVMLA